jgi:hypothetical protein
MVNEYAKGGKVIIQPNDYQKYKKIGIADKYYIEAFNDIGLSGVNFDSITLNKLLEEKFNELLESYKDYVITEDSEAITRTIKQEIEARRLQGDSIERINEYEQMLTSQNDRQRYINDYAENQSKTLSEWVSYLKQSEYSIAFKYLVLKAILNYNYDYKINKLIERNNKTTRNFVGFDAASLAELNQLNSDYLLKDYTEIQVNNSANILKSKEVIKSSGNGRWIKFDGGNKTSGEEKLKNAKELSQLVQNTYWCTKTNSESQLDGGDFYVYVTETNGEIFPRIAIRMDEDNVGEVRGNKSAAQDLEEEMLPIAEDFLENNIPNNSGKKWLESIKYNSSVIAFKERLITEGTLFENSIDIYFDLKVNEQKYLVDYADSNGNLSQVNEIILDYAKKGDLTNNPFYKKSDFYFHDELLSAAYFKGANYTNQKYYFGNIEPLFPDSVSGIDWDKKQSVKVTIPQLKLEEDLIEYVFGHVDLDGTNFKKIGSLKGITHSLRLGESSIIDLGNLKTIGGDIKFTDSKIKSLGNLTTIGGDAYFKYTLITDLGNLTSIGGDLHLEGSEIKDLKKLTTIGRNAYFPDSKITKLGNLTTIGGTVNFTRSSIKSLGNLTTIGGDARFNGVEIKSLANLKTIGGNATFRDSQVASLGALTTIGGDVTFSYSEIKDLGNLKTIGGGADFSYSKVASLGVLTTIGETAHFRDSEIKDLANLISIGGDANFRYSQVASLGNLKTINGSAYFDDCKIKDLANLTSIGEYFYPGTNVKSLGNLEFVGRNAYFTGSKLKSLGKLRTIVANADFEDSQVTDLGALTTIGGNATFNESKITSLGNLTTIGRNGDFRHSQIKSLGKLSKIGGYFYFNNSKVEDIGNLKAKGKVTNWQEITNCYNLGFRAFSGGEELSLEDCQKTASDDGIFMLSPSYFKSNITNYIYKNGGTTKQEATNIKNKEMEKETYCVVVVQFDNGVKRTTEVMPKQLAEDWVHKYGGRAENCEVFECTADGEHLRKLETPKMELGGGVEPLKNAKGEYALYPENPTKKSMGLLLEYGGTASTSSDMSAPILGGTMGSSMRDGGNVDDNTIENFVNEFAKSMYWLDPEGKPAHFVEYTREAIIVAEVFNPKFPIPYPNRVSEDVVKKRIRETAQELISELKERYNKEYYLEFIIINDKKEGFILRKRHTKGVMRTGGNLNEPKAKTYKEWISLMRKDNYEHNQNAHEDDVIPFWEWVSEMGAMYGFKPMKDSGGDTIVVRTQDNPPNKEEVLAYIKESKSVYADEDGDLDEVGEEQLAEAIAEKFNIDVFDAYEYFEETEMRTGGNVGSDWQVMFESRSGSGKVSSVIVQATNLAEAKSKAWTKSGLDKKYFAFLTAYEKKALGGNITDKTMSGIYPIKAIIKFLMEDLKEKSDYAILKEKVETNPAEVRPNLKQFVIMKAQDYEQQHADYITDRLISEISKGKMMAGGRVFDTTVYPLEEYPKEVQEEYNKYLKIYGKDTADTYLERQPAPKGKESKEYLLNKKITEAIHKAHENANKEIKKNKFGSEKQNAVLWKHFRIELSKIGKIQDRQISALFGEKINTIWDMQKYLKQVFIKQLEFGGSTDQKKNDNDDISQYYDMEFALGGGVPNQKQMDIITKKIGLSEQNAEYLIGMSPKFAVWLGDIIFKDKFQDEKASAISLSKENPHLPVGDQLTDKFIRIDALSYLNNGTRTQTNLVRTYQEGIRLILDWLMHPLTPKQNLRELDFFQAVQKSQQFHKELQALGGDVNFVEDSENEIIKRYPLTDEGVEYYWVGIPKGYCDIESKRMGHCGRTGHGGLISLRSIKPYGKGHTINDSHVTIAYDEDDNLFYQVKGKKNQKPAEKYHSYIFDLIKTLASDPQHLFMGFGSEYASSEDYGFDDMTKEQIGELYKINKGIFDGFAGKLVLYDAGVIKEKPETTFTIEKGVSNVDDLLRVDRYLGSRFVEDILEGNMEPFDSSWSYFYDNYKDCLENLNAANEQKVVEEIMRLTNHTEEEVISNGIHNYLAGNVDEFDEDDFDGITRALANAHVYAEESEYLNHYKHLITDALENLGFIKKLNYEGLIIEINLQDLLTTQQITTYMKSLGNEELVDVFYEAVSDGDIELPYFDIDDGFSASPENKEINMYFANEDLEKFKRGGITKKEVIQKKIGKVMHEFKHKELKTPQGKRVTNPKQAIAIGYSEGRSAWENRRKK